MLYIATGTMKNRNPHQQELRLFFTFWMVYSFVALVTTNYEGKTNLEIINNLFLRQMSGLIIGLLTSVGTLLGKALFYYLRNKKSKNENDHN